MEIILDSTKPGRRYEARKNRPAPIKISSRKTIIGMAI
jgi:hypothetical protein